MTITSLPSLPISSWLQRYALPQLGHNLSLLNSSDNNSIDDDCSFGELIVSQAWP